MADFRPLVYNTPEELTSISSADSVKLLTAVPSNGTDSSKRILRDIKFSTLTSFVTSNTYGKYSAIGDYYNKIESNLSNRIVLYPTENNIPYANFVPGYRIRYLATEDNSEVSDSINYDRYSVTSPSQSYNALFAKSPSEEVQVNNYIQDASTEITYKVTEIIGDILVLTQESGTPLVIYEANPIEGNLIQKSQSSNDSYFDGITYLRSTNEYNILYQGYYQTSADTDNLNWKLDFESTIESKSITGIRIYSELTRPHTIKLSQYDSSDDLIKEDEFNLSYQISSNSIYSEVLFTPESSIDYFTINIISVENLGQNYCYIKNIEFQTSDGWILASSINRQVQNFDYDTNTSNYEICSSDKFINNVADSDSYLLSLSDTVNYTGELIIEVLNSESIIGLAITGSFYNRIKSVTIYGASNLNNWSGSPLVTDITIDGNDSEILLNSGNQVKYKYYKIVFKLNQESPLLFTDIVAIDCIGLIYRDTSGTYAVQCKLSENAVGNDYIGGTSQFYPVYLDTSKTPLESGSIRGGRIVELTYCEVEGSELILDRSYAPTANVGNYLYTGNISNPTNKYFITGLDISLNRLYLTIPTDEEYNDTSSTKIQITNSISNSTYTDKFFIMTNPYHKYIDRVGEIIMVADDQIRPDTMLCDGRQLRVAEYSSLFNKIGYRYCDKEWDEKISVPSGTTTLKEVKSWADHPDSAFTIVKYNNKSITMTNSKGKKPRTMSLYTATNTNKTIVLYPQYKIFDVLNIGDAFGTHFIVNDWTVKFYNNSTDISSQFSRKLVDPSKDSNSDSYSVTYRYTPNSSRNTNQKVTKITINAKTGLCWYNATGHKNVKCGPGTGFNKGYSISYQSHEDKTTTNYKIVQHRNDPAYFKLPNLQNHLIQGGSTIDKVGTAYTSASSPGGLQPYSGGTLPLNFLIYYQ